jgi:hypothetical protein
MSDYKVIVPEATTNLVLNPSAELAGNFVAAPAGGTVTRVTTYAKYNVYSFRVQTAADNEGIRLSIPVLANAIHYLTLVVRGTLPPAWTWSLNAGAGTAPAVIATLDASWTLYGLQFSAAEAVGSVSLDIWQNGAGAGDFYIDGLQLEQKTYWTTYCDGDQPGCFWNGVPHASTSTRSAQSRAGGRERDLRTDYYLDIGYLIEAGTPPITQILDEYAILPGGRVQGYKTHARSFTLSGLIQATSLATFHQRRQDLLGVLSPMTGPGNQPVLLRYNGSTVDKEIAVRYEGGLQLEMDAADCYWERVALRLLADDPYWYEIGESGALLDVDNLLTFRYVTGRLRSTGQWSALGLTANPTTNGTIYAIAYNPWDNRVYVGGDFTGMDGVVGRDYAAVYDLTAGVWLTLGGASVVGAAVRAIAIAPNGDVYFGGDFTDLGGATGDYAAYWDISAAAWAPVSGGGTIGVRALAFGTNGYLYIGGTFLDWNAIGAADGIVSWDGAAYAAVGAGVSGGGADVFALACDKRTGVIYAGGDFTSPAYYIARWNPATVTWDDVESDVVGDWDGAVYALAFGLDGTLYAGGAFATAGDVVAAHVAQFNGTSVEPLGDGCNDTVRALTVGPDGLVWVGGDFTGGGGLTTCDAVLVWTGASWARLDVDLVLASSPSAYALAIGSVDPVIPRLYDVFVGFDETGAGSSAGATAVTNSGTADAYPTIELTNTGVVAWGSYSIRNETTGDWILLDATLQPSEVLTIDLKPTRKRVWSSFFGDRQDVIVPNSDFGAWHLQPGAQVITVWGASTIIPHMVWRDPYLSAD